MNAKREKINWDVSSIIKPWLRKEKMWRKSWQGQFSTNSNNMWPFNVYQQPMSNYYDYYLPYEYNRQHHNSRSAMRNGLLYY